MPLSDIYIRADATSLIGVGHFARCLNLAKKLEKRGVSITFLSRNLPKNMAKQAIYAGCRVIDLYPAHDGRPQLADDYGSWLGVTQEEDFFQCMEYVNETSNCFFIIDHYGVNDEWLAHARFAGAKVMIFDDLAERKLDVDIVVNQNLGWTNEHYVDLIGPNTNLLLGPKYAVLSENYFQERLCTHRKFDEHGALRVLISLGGSDPNNVSEKIARCLISLDFSSDFLVSIAVGPLNRNLDALSDLAFSAKGKVKLFVGQDSLVNVYSENDIAIGAVGGSSWERCCLGLPTILVPVADNQLPAAHALQEVGAGITVDYKDEQFEFALKCALETICNKSVRQEMSLNSMKICDGQGADRLAKKLIDFDG